MITSEVADRVYRLAHAYVSCYLVEDDGRVLLVDAGLPAMWPMLADALREHALGPDDVTGLVLTHAHFDHTGFAARAQDRLRVPVWAHEEDFFIAEHPYRYAHENPRALYPIRHPRAVRILASMTRAGALRVPGVRGMHALRAGDLPDAPGSPVVVPTPGHTAGHCALHLLGRDAVLSGDALVTLDPYTGDTGPQIVAGAATADSTQALASLDALAATGATTVLPGHGEPWTAGVASAVQAARATGAH
ncbi:MBL fold metallo-hydrolase [Cellulomonas xylanilytica]|uniref:MBL fold metallo-hydrolase n=1 Tax=Cellulomonas xylanilytica TaxID=233583 RepID=A0A510V9A6_9CELL|nr:MBL fold metallo-hydrolase [Cellulomonas xylanilytica]GEK23453.1 MBL fold metallo-hydrolase [Cellulomonas xylanilytica]